MILEFTRTGTNADLLWEEIKTAYPDLISMSTGPFGIKIRANDEFSDVVGLETLITQHDPYGVSTAQRKIAEKEIKRQWIVDQFDADVIRGDIVANRLSNALEKIVQALEALQVLSDE